MPDPVDALVLDLLEWIGDRPRPYAEVMEAWRTSCPRLPVWEDANARGYLQREHREGSGAVVVVTPSGRAALARRIVRDTPVAAPLPHHECPACGGPNECAPARSGTFDTSCWCASVTVCASALAGLPVAQRDRACLCRKCAMAAGPRSGR